MLSEEALIVVAAFGACGLLVLGVLELVWPTRPRHPVRRPPARRPHRAPRQAPLPVPVVTPVATAAVAEAVAPLLLEPVSVEPVTTSAASVVDDCFALHQAGRYADVVELAVAALRGDGEVPRPDGEQAIAALWSIVALARQGLGEPAEARTALEAAVAAAPDADRPTYQRQLATLVEGVAHRLLADAEQHPRGDSEECLEAIRSAVEWLERGLVGAPVESGLARLSVDAQSRLWQTYERSAMALLQRQEFRAARRLLQEALEDPRLPAARADAFRELVSGTFDGEIGHLTAQAIRSVQDGRDPDALRALRRAEALLATLGDEALSSKRREEVNRRLWWVSSRLGEREETRALVARALNAAPDREAAMGR